MRWQIIPKDDRHELIKCKEHLKAAEARRQDLDLQVDTNRAILSVLKRRGEKNTERYCAFLEQLVSTAKIRRFSSIMYPKHITNRLFDRLRMMTSGPIYIIVYPRGSSRMKYRLFISITGYQLCSKFLTRHKRLK